MIDGRIFSFGKYSLPKTCSLTKSNQDCTIGYFDLVNVKAVEPDEKYDSVMDQLLMSFFNQTHVNFEHVSEISEQNLFAFTNVSDNEFFNTEGYSFAKDKLDEFWKNENTFNRFFSLMHIDCSFEKEIYGVINWLNYIFNESCDKYNAVFYFSFDYSDLIICVKNMSVVDFTKKLFDVNYSAAQACPVDNYSFCIKDSFSIITFNKKFLEESFNVIGNNITLEYGKIEELIKKEIEKTEYQYTKEELNIVYNIGVQNMKTFNNFVEDLHSVGMSFQKFAMLGRHDITINKSGADIIWFIVLLYYIDKYTTCTGNENQKDNLLFNCESFIRSDFEFSYESQDLLNQNEHHFKSSIERYEMAKTSIKNRIERITNFENSPVSLVQKNSLFSLYKSIESTLKNGFADDFVICLYESFVALLDYLYSKKEKSSVEDIKEFDKVINRFFEIVTSLVNSAMHSDRQFIQTPSFNPVFFDVPPKLMAFYTAQINKIKQINGHNDNNNYSFIFKPSLNRNITIFPYSYNQAPPTDRLLAVSINEESLYHPTKVLKVLCHEVSHFVGTEKRCRGVRKECWLKSVLFCSFKLILSYLDDNIKNDKNLYSSISTLVFEIFKVIENDIQYKTHMGYSEDIDQLLHHVFKLLNVHTDIDNALTNFFLKKYPGYNVSVLKSRFKKLVLVLDEFIPINNEVEMMSNLVIAQEFHQSYQVLLNAYKESYADIQMILLLDLTLDDYINNLIVHEKMDFERFMSDITFYKIFPVVYTLVVLGKWEITEDENACNKRPQEYNKIMEQIKKCIISQYKQMPIGLNSKISFGKGTNLEEITKDLSDEANDLLIAKDYYVVYSISKYLAASVEKTEESFLDDAIKKEKKSLVELNRNIFNQKDSVGIFSYVQKTNEEYLNRIISEQIN